MVPMIQEDGECGVAYEFLDLPTRTCATLLCCLTLVSGEDTYVIRVSDTSEFTVGDILQIGTRTDRFTITDIIDATHIEATVDPVPGATVDIDEGTSICIVDCCEIIEAFLDDLLPDPVSGIVQESAANGGVTLDSGSPTLEGTIVSIVVTNPSSVRSFKCIIDVNIILTDAQLDNANTDFLTFETALHFGTTTPPPAIVGGDQTYFMKDDTQHPVFNQRTWIATQIIAPSAAVTFYARGVVTWAEAGASALVIPANSLLTNLRVFGIAL